MKLVPVAIASCALCRETYDFRQWKGRPHVPSKKGDFKGSERRACECGAEMVALVDFIPEHGLWENAERYQAEHPHSARPELHGLDLDELPRRMSPTPLELSIVAVALVLLVVLASALLRLWQVAP